MRNPTSPRLTAATVEDLLDGRGASTPLRGLLAAAAAPGRAEEIAGEAAARAAFATARATAPSPAPEWIAPARPVAGRLLAAKVLALVVVAAGATGGVALAANSSLARPLVTAHPATGAAQSAPGEHHAGTTTSTPTLTATPTAARPTTVVEAGGPDPTTTHATAQGHSTTSACAAGGCGPHARSSDPSTADATISPTTAATAAAVPLAAAPLADAPSATPTTEALSATESQFAVRLDSGQGAGASASRGGVHD